MWRRPAAQAVPAALPAAVVEDAVAPRALTPAEPLVQVVQAPSGVAVGPVRALGCRGGKSRRARDACDRPAAAMDAFSRSVAGTQECMSAASRPARVEYSLRYVWERRQATLEMRTQRGSAPQLLPADKSRCLSSIRDYFLSIAPAEAPHAAAEYRWSLTTDYLKDSKPTP